MKQNMAAKFSAARALFPHTSKIVYFNSASTGPFCTPVGDAICTHVEQRLAADKDESHDAFATSEWLRGAYAKMIGAPKRTVGIGLNTSYGLNMAAFGLPLKKGDEILVSDVEFPAIAYTWKAAAEARGLKIKFIKSRDRCFDVEAFKKAIGKRTRVLSLSFVQFFNGYKNDVTEIAEICRKHHLYFVVDGIQGMGVESINVVKSGIDIFTSGCQKWMLAPQGCGFFYLSDRVRDTMTPPVMSWLGVDWKLKFGDLFHYDRPWHDSAQKFELGYYVVLNLLGMKAAAKVFQDLGIANIQKHNHALIDRLAKYIRSNPYYRITCSMEPKHRSSIFTFACDRGPELYKELTKNKIILSQREGSIRVSVHLFNDESDIERLIEVLKRFAR